jgi:hypothetical protein
MPSVADCAGARVAAASATCTEVTASDGAGADDEPPADGAGAADAPTARSSSTPEEDAREARIDAALRQLVMSHCTGAETGSRKAPSPGDSSAPEGTATQDSPDSELRRRVLERDGWVCTIPGCGARTELEVDHILPRARFPSLLTDESNLTTICHRCHGLKTLGLLRVARTGDGLAVTRPDRWQGRPGRAASQVDGT